MFQFDLYSCSNFKPKDVLNHLDDWFGLTEAHWQFIDRNGNDFKVIDSGHFKKSKIKQIIDIFKRKQV
jgi:hypothetical protein